MRGGGGLNKLVSVQSVAVHKPGDENPTYGWNNAVCGCCACASVRERTGPVSGCACEL